MAEIDPVVLELRAELGKYRADLKSTTSMVQASLGQQERSVQRLERQMQRSSGAIGATLRGLAGTLGTYFTGRELTGLIDSFTRLQNSLRVAGLEGAKLESVQASLLDLSTKYGVGIEGLANLYGKATDAGRSFGASEAEILQLTEATSQALLITGTSAAQAQGAILGLSQALASGTVRAEEYNQINEGGLRPLLQAAAASEKFGGDINKLRAAVLAGKVSSQEFFAAIQTGSAQLSGQASKATLTLSGAFEALTSRLTVYIGQSAQANGVTAALAGALQLLANNLETIIPALAIIGTGLGVGLVANAVRARIALLAASGAAVTLAGTATAAGRALLAAFGGPVGVAITALVVGIGYLVTQTDAAARAAKEAELQAIRTASAQETERRATELLAAAKGSEKSAQIAATKASRDRAAQALQTAKALQAEARASLVAARAEARKIFENSAGDTGFLATLGRGLGGAGGAGPTVTPGTGKANRIGLSVSAAQAKLDASERKIAALEGEVEGLTAAIGDGAKAPTLPAASTGDGKKRGRKGGGGASGPSIAEIEGRFQSELASIAQQTLSARQALATSAEDRAEIELRGVEAARQEALRSLAADKEYSEAQKARVRDALENLAEFERERIARDRRIQLFEEARDLGDAENRAQAEALRQQYDLARSQSERRDLAYEIIDLEYRYRDAALRAVEENEDLADAVRQRAAIERAALASGRDRTMESARRDTAGPLEDYFDRAKKDAAELNEAYQQIAVDGLGSVTDALTETATGFLKLGGIAGKVVNGIISDLIRLAIQQQIVGLFGDLFGGGKQRAASGIASGVGKFFGRASGGYVAPGQTVRVNESRGGAEYLRMGSQGGTVIPLGQVNAQAAREGSNGGGVVRIMIEEAPGFASTVRAEATGVAIEVVQATAPTIIQGAVGETQRRMSRPRMPGAGR